MYKMGKSKTLDTRKFTESNSLNVGFINAEKMLNAILVP